jgi:hypothetical protein
VRSTYPAASTGRLSVLGRPDRYRHAVTFGTFWRSSRATSWLTIGWATLLPWPDSTTRRERLRPGPATSLAPPKRSPGSLGWKPGRDASKPPNASSKRSPKERARNTSHTRDWPPFTWRSASCHWPHSHYSKHSVTGIGISGLRVGMRAGRKCAEPSLVSDRDTGIGWPTCTRQFPSCFHSKLSRHDPW